MSRDGGGDCEVDGNGDRDGSEDLVWLKKISVLSVLSVAPW